MFSLKKIIILVVSIFIFMAGCQTGEGTSGETTQTEGFDDKVSEKMDKQTEEIRNLDLHRVIEESEDKGEVVIEEKVFVEKYEIDSESWRVRPLDGQNEQVVLLTIDDAPDQYSVDMAETLAELEAGAIFFVNGHFLSSEEGQAKLKMIDSLGFEIGNHTMNHPNLSNLSKEEQKKEIIELNDLVEEIIGKRPKFFRAPFGVNTEESRAIVDQEGMLLMNWTYGYDWEQEYQDAQELAHIMTETPLLTNGANLLMHDRKWTAEALESIVIGLREQGYEPIDPREIKIK